MTYAKKLRHLLADREMTLTAFARRLGVTQPRVSRWLTGETRPDIDEGLTIARFFGVSLDWLADPRRGLEEVLGSGSPAPVPAGPADDVEDLTPFFPAADLGPRGNRGGRRGA